MSNNKKQDIYRGRKDKGYWFLDEFEHIYTCWANHRNNWSKAKRLKSVTLNVGCAKIKKMKFNKN